MEEDFQEQFGSFWGEGMMLLNWFPKLVDSHVDFLANTFTSLVIPSPPTLSTNLSLQPPTLNTPSTSTTAVTPSFDIATAAQQLVRKVGQGLLGAAYAGMVLSLVMLVAVIMGVVAVNQVVEHPVVLRQKLHFDYTDLNPEALYVFGDGLDKIGGGVPVGHTFYVSVQLLVPDSDYNRDIGVFQLMAEVISTNGKVIARSSQPSMLQFQSHPIRLVRTFAMGLPILLGFTRETQKIMVPMLNYKEDSHMRTGAVKITLMPRAGTVYLPQLYEAEILMHSKLPRVKELVYNWKWTFYVWTSAYIYILLVMLLIFFFKPLLVFPVLRSSAAGVRRVVTFERAEKQEARMPEEKEFADKLRKWQQYRKKRKAELLTKGFDENVSSTTAATSYTVTKDDMVPDIDEDTGDSESVCKGVYV